MAQYTNLNAPPERSLREIIDEKIQTRGSATGAAGVKDLGAAGDVLWTRPDGGAVSVRDVDLDLADARQRLEEAETSLTGTGARLDAAEQAVQDVRDELANIEVGGGGPLIHDRIPAPSDGEDKPAGTAWLVYGQDGTLTSVWQWDGTVWEEMPLDAALIPVLDIGSGTFGNLEGARLVVDDTLSARVVQAMSAEVKELVVTESAVLNHVTAIGQTVVDDINVQGKLVGVDGVFKGTVDFENVNVTGELLAAAISGEYVYGTVLEGGVVRAGGGTTGDIVVLGDDTFHPSDGTAPRPGLMVAEGGTTYTRVPGVGVSAHGGVEVSGGATPEGGNAYMYSSPFGVFAYSNPGSNSRTGYSTRLGVGMDGTELLAQKDGEATVSIRASAPLVSGGQTLLPPRAIIQVSDSSGTSNIDVRASHAQLTSGSREIRVDDTGVWVKTKKSGSWESWNLEETAKDTGWIDMTFSGGHTNDSTGANFQYRLTGNVMHLRGRVRPVSGVYAQGGVYQVAVLPANLRPTATQRTIVAGGGSTQWCRLEVSASQGTVRIASMSGASDWIDLTGTSWSLD